MAKDRTIVDDKSIQEEVDWILDPGTHATRAMQFMHTQALAWHLKTLLAKLMNTQEALNGVAF